MKVVLRERDLANLACILSGAFAPLAGFMVEEDWRTCCSQLTLADGRFFPLPIVLPVNLATHRGLATGCTCTLVTPTNLPVATIKVESVWKPDIAFECRESLGTTDDNHPYVAHLQHLMLSAPETHYIGGPITALQPIPTYDFLNLRKTCAETRALFKARGAKTIVGFQTRNPMHRCHFALTRYALEKCGDPLALLFLNPVVGPTQPGDVPYPTRVRCYLHMLKRYPDEEKDRVVLNLLPMAMRMAGPREACLHALMRKNHGCTHFVVGRDHAGPSCKTKDGQTFYDPYDAQTMLTKYADVIGIQPIYSKMLMYDPNDGKYKTEHAMSNHPSKPGVASRSPSKPGVASRPPSKPGVASRHPSKPGVASRLRPTRALHLSGTELRRRLRSGEPIPEWFSYPEVVRELRLAQRQRGVCVYFVGLSGAGKSTLMQRIAAMLRERMPTRDVTMLDGDEIRQHLSKGLGFSKQDRSTNVRRVGYVASEIVRHGGLVLCANIAPYAADRAYNRHVVTSLGGTYLEVYVDTPLAVCEERDAKGLYKRARAGELKQFTGISDPFEVPQNPDFTTWPNLQLGLLPRGCAPSTKDAKNTEQKETIDECIVRRVLQHNT